MLTIVFLVDNRFFSGIQLTIWMELHCMVHKLSLGGGEGGRKGGRRGGCR